MTKYTQLPLALPDDPIEIQLAKGYVAIVDKQDADLAKIKWGTSSDKKWIYAVTSSSKNRNSMHRIVMERIVGRHLAKDELIDHINHNTLDNRRDNLRIATFAGNSRNRAISPFNKLGLKGVYKRNDYNAYAAEIKVNNKRIRLGIFKTPEEAAAAYNAGAVKYHGDFASLNDIPNWKEIVNNFPETRLNLRNKSGYKGVGVQKGKWCAYVYINKKSIHIGTYNSPIEAHEAREKYLKDNS